jgi:hypothetical protein
VVVVVIHFSGHRVWRIAPLVWWTRWPSR